MDFADTAARKLLRGVAAASARGVAAASDNSFSLWQLVKDIFASLLAALTSVVHELFLPLEDLWRWLQTAVAVLLPVALVILLVALVLYCWPALFAVGVGVGRALVCTVCYFGHGLYFVAVAVARALAFLLPCFGHCCAVVTMRGPGAAGMLISRAAFVANPALYFRILRSAGPVVAGAVFCLRTIASVVAAPVAALFRA